MEGIACQACGNSTFHCVDERYIVCSSCGHQDSEEATMDDEVEMDKDGKSRFGSFARTDMPMVDRKGNVILDTSMPYQRPTKTSLGSVVDEYSKRYYKRLRINRLIEEILCRLIDPLNIRHSNNVVSRTRRTCQEMFSKVLHDPVENIYTSSIGATDEEENEETTAEDDMKILLKNRGNRKKAIFVHIAYRVILHFIPGFDEKYYKMNVIRPFFGGTMKDDIKRCVKFMKQYGVPVVQRVFSSFERQFEEDYVKHLHCKLRKLFEFIHFHGQYAKLYQDDGFDILFEGAGILIFHPHVVSTLQSWKFWTRVGTLLCLLKMTNPKEVVSFICEIDEDPVKEITICNHLVEPIGIQVINNAFHHSPDWKFIFEEFAKLI